MPAGATWLAATWLAATWLAARQRAVGTLAETERNRQLPPVR
jgi:hypothetical protein